MQENGNITTSGTQRIEYIDALRGFTMFLVVLEHVAGMCWGIVGKGISIHDYLVQVRMPLFFFISGFVLYKAGVVWDTRQIVRFFKKKIPVQLISPFIFFALFLHYKDMPLIDGLMDKFKAGYWFTLALLEYYIIYAAVKFTVRRWWSSIILVIIGCVLYYFCWPKMAIGNQTIDNVMQLLSVHQWRFFLFFVLGTLAREHFGAVERCLDGKWLIPVCVVFYLVVNLLGDVLPVKAIPMRALLSLTGLVIVFSFFRNKQALFSHETRLGRTLQYVGRRTLDIYLIHYFLIPTGLRFITVFRAHPMPVIEAFVTSAIAVIIIAASLLVSNIIRLSPFLAHWLFGAKVKTGN